MGGPGLRWPGTTCVAVAVCSAHDEDNEAGKSGVMEEEEEKEKKPRKCLEGSNGFFIYKNISENFCEQRARTNLWFLTMAELKAKDLSWYWLSSNWCCGFMVVVTAKKNKLVLVMICNSFDGYDLCMMRLNLFICENLH